MFVERVTQPRAEWEQWSEWLRLDADPPPALAASIAWEADDGTVITINVWDSPSAIADMFVERVQPIRERHGPPTNKPERLGTAVRAYMRPTLPPTSEQAT